MQLQMTACFAYMAGYDVKSDKVRTCAFICLVGISVNKLLKEAGVKMENKVAMRLVKKYRSKLYELLIGQWDLG